MREILFRGKHKDSGEWVEGVPYFENNQCFMIIDLFICEEYQCTGAENVEVIPETIGQYTGLTDKNGKKIFEGDVVKITDRNVCFDTMAVIEFGNPILSTYCEIDLHEYALDLINRQKAKNESLKVDLAKCSIRLDNLYKTADEIKYEVIKEVEKRLKSKRQWDTEFENMLVFDTDIDNILKEMMEDI